MSVVDSYGALTHREHGRTARLTVFHAFAVRGRIDSDVHALTRNSNGVDSEIPLHFRHLLHIFQTIDTPQRCCIMEQFRMYLLDLQALSIKG